MVITEITPLQKGKVHILFESGEALVLYKGEARALGLEEQNGMVEISDALYEQIYYEIVGKRARKRALHLLEKMDRTEEQLRKKLTEGQYPPALVEDAISYVKSYHYIDDERYARNFVRLNQERKSNARMKMDLLSKGVAPDLIECALDEENETEQETLIMRLLEKKHYDADQATLQETKKIYQFLLRRGFRSDEIMHVLRFPANFL